MNEKLIRLQGVAGGILACSLATTLVLIALNGAAQEALPLHLCSISALCALLLSLGATGTPLDFLWYLGMPGALLALLFPAPASSRYQALLDASYYATHALILILPLLTMAGGRCPRTGRAADMMLLLQAIALLAWGINRRLGTNFLFLSAPPAQTPLETAYAWGYPAYIACLEAIMLAVCLLMNAALRAIRKRRTQ